MTLLHMIEEFFVNGLIITSLAIIGFVFTIRNKISMKSRYAIFPAWILLILGCVQFRNNFSEPGQTIWLAVSITASSLICFAIFNWARPSANPQFTAAPAVPSVVVSPTISPIFAPIIEQSQEQKLTQSPAVSRETSKALAPVPKLELVEPLHNLYIGETREWASVWIEASGGLHKGLIAEFKNIPDGEQGATAEGVIAYIVYVNKRGNRLSIDSGCWMNWPTQRLNIDPGKPSKLVLAVAVKDDQEVFALENRREEIPILIGRYHRKLPWIPSIMPTPIGELPCNLQILLIDEAKRKLYDGHFVMDRDHEGNLRLSKNKMQSS